PAGCEAGTCRSQAGRNSAPSSRGQGSRYFPARHDGNGLHRGREPAVLDAGYQLQQHGVLYLPSVLPKTGAWDNLQKSLKGDFNDSVWEHLAGTVSEPFVLGRVCKPPPEMPENPLLAAQRGVMNRSD